MTREAFMKREELLKVIVDELKHSEITGLWKPNYKEGFNDGITKAVEVISKFLREPNS